MKKGRWNWTWIFTSLLILLAGCSAVVNQPQTDAEKSEPFRVHYIRTNGIVEGAQYPITTVITDVVQLQEYYEQNKDLYDFKNEWGDSVSFQKAVAAYNEAFFENNALILVVLEEGSGSVWHNVERLSRQNGTLQIDIRRTTPEVYTTDMAQWHIILEVDKKLTKNAGIKVSLQDAPSQASSQQ